MEKEKEENYIPDIHIGDFAYNREKRRQVENPLKVIDIKQSESGLYFLILDNGKAIFSEPAFLCDKFEK